MGRGQDTFDIFGQKVKAQENELVDKETENMIKKAEKLQKKKEAISKDVRKRKFEFKTRGKISKKESGELKMTHNIFDWVLGERQRMFMTRRLCRDILEGILTETVTHIGKEMATNVMEKVLSKVMVEATVNKLMKEAEGYGHEVITGLEYKFNEKRMEEEMAIKMMLDEIQREERLEIQKRKKEDWRVSYWRLQEQEMTVHMRNLTLLEQAIFMEWETEPETVALEEMDTNAQEVTNI